MTTRRWQYRTMNDSTQNDRDKRNVKVVSTEKLTLGVKEVDFHRIGKDVSKKKTTVVLSSRSSCHLVIFVSVPVEPGLLWVESPLRRAEDRPRRCLGHVVGRRKRLACKGKNTVSPSLSFHTEVGNCVFLSHACHVFCCHRYTNANVFEWGVNFWIQVIGFISPKLLANPVPLSLQSWNWFPTIHLIGT